MPPEYSHYSNDTQLEQALNEAEQMLVSLKERFTQVKEAKRCKEELLQQQNILKQKQRSNGGRNNRQQIKSQLQRINQELETIEVSLESSLFSWSSLQEPFWLALRFGGLGVVIGWFFKVLGWLDRFFPVMSNEYKKRYMMTKSEIQLTAKSQQL